MNQNKTMLTVRNKLSFMSPAPCSLLRCSAWVGHASVPVGLIMVSYKLLKICQCTNLCCRSSPEPVSEQLLSVSSGRCVSS